jgi:hypothetical protein
MSDKLVVLKLLWSNLKYLKEKGQSPDQTFDFLNEDSMVKYLFNEDQRYIELLLLTLEMQSVETLQKLNPEFVKMWSGFWSDKVQKMESKAVESKTVESKKVVDEKVEVEIEEDSVAEEDVADEADSVGSDEGDVNSFITQYLGEDEDSKVSLESILEKYAEYCESNDMDNDEEELESSLVEKFGKPKGKKKPKFLGVRLLA